MKQNYWTYNKPLSVTGLGGGVASLSFKGASSKYDSNTFYPIFGIKMDTSGFVPYTWNDISTTPPNATKIELFARRKLLKEHLVVTCFIRSVSKIILIIQPLKF